MHLKRSEGCPPRKNDPTLASRRQREAVVFCKRYPGWQAETGMFCSVVADQRELVCVWGRRGGESTLYPWFVYKPARLGRREKFMNIHFCLCARDVKDYCSRHTFHV